MKETEIWGRRKKFGVAIAQVLTVVGTFFIISVLFYGMNEGWINAAFAEKYLVLFAISIFLGSAAYDLCSSIAKMSSTLFLRFLNQSINGFITLIIAVMVTVICALLMSYDKNSWMFAIGWFVYLIMLIYVFVLVKRFDSFATNIIKDLKSEQRKELLESLSEYFDKRYLLKKVDKRKNSGASQK